MDNILILSKDTAHTETLKAGLEKTRHFGVTIAIKGKEAIAFFDKIKVSVLVTDIRLSDMDVLDLLSYMTQKHSATPCIVMTDHGKPWFKEKMARQSLLYHIEKPFKVSSLLSAIFVGLTLRDEGKNLKGMTMASVLPLIEILQKTCRMEAKADNQKKGYLYFNEGVLIDAHFNDLRGESAAREIAGWEGIAIKFTDLPERRTRTRVKTHLMDMAEACWDKSEVIAPADDAAPCSEEIETEDNASSAPQATVPPPPPDDSPDDDIIILSSEIEAENSASSAPHETVPAAVDEPPDEIIILSSEIEMENRVPAHKEDDPVGRSNMGKEMYLEYYQLVRKPFQINTDPAFLWFGEKQKEALATLKYGIQENKGFLLLTGDVGVGKTTIIKSFLQGLDKSHLAVVVYTPVLDSLDFFNYVARLFGLPGDFTTKGAFLDAFNDFLLKVHYQGKRVLLIIDECQLLSPSLLAEIKLFLNFEKNGSTLINICFVGQLEFNDILLYPENRGIRQRVAVNYCIPPLSLKETEHYIEYRLAVAGTDKKIFKPNAIREIFHFSKGYPRLINIIADRALLTGYVNSARQIKKNIIKECISELEISPAGKSPVVNKDKFVL
jgi:type II secretory pathway predicted ATPase ExeA/CheY-like chemotaxis protein